MHTKQYAKWDQEHLKFEAPETLIEILTHYFDF